MFGLLGFRVSEIRPPAGNELCLMPQNAIVIGCENPSGLLLHFCALRHRCCSTAFEELCNLTAPNLCDTLIHICDDRVK